MALQNRVTPFGEIAALSGRGLLMGNRGVLHNEERRIVRTWQTRRWIACRTEFRGRHREIMRPNRWTELFFLDEATAFAAGHRPCAECRYADYQRFRSLWSACYGEPVSADIIDARMHADRLEDRMKRIHRENIDALPNGTYVIIDGNAWLVWKSKLYAWSDRGYTASRARPANLGIDVLTPASTVAVLAAGYHPGVHPSIGDNG